MFGPAQPKASGCGVPLAGVYQFCRGALLAGPQHLAGFFAEPQICPESKIQGFGFLSGGARVTRCYSSKEILTDNLIRSFAAVAG